MLCKLIGPSRRTIRRMDLTRHGAKHRNLACARHPVRRRFRCRYQGVATNMSNAPSVIEDARPAAVELDRHGFVRELHVLFGAEPAGPRLLEQLLEVAVG